LKEARETIRQEQEPLLDRLRDAMAKAKL